MGIAGDLLSAATPTRLICRRGTWSLELERLVAVERDVYQPRTQRLEGTDAVLRHLQRATNTALAHAASTLIRSTHVAEECAFEALDSEWIPCEPRTRGESSRPSALAAANATVLELRAELCLLRATHSGLRERLARLEYQLAAVRAREAVPPRSIAPAAQAERSVSPSLPSPNRAAAPAASPSPPAPAPTQTSAPAPEVPPNLTDSTSATSDTSAPSVNRPSPLKLPSIGAVGTCLKTLIGKKITLREAPAAGFPPNGKQPHWFSRLIDDDGNEVGALVTDLLATVALGGALMMIPPHELDAQRTAKKPSEDVMSAMAEVMNNLSATINQVPEGLHVRVRALEAMADCNLDWTKGAAQGVDWQLDEGLGHLFLFAR